jgi:hypothetical protein
VPLTERLLTERLLTERFLTECPSELKEYVMIKQVSHTATGVGAADLALALDAAYELHPPVASSRAPEVAAPQMMGLRTAAARPHRRKVPLNRLTSVRG